MAAGAASTTGKIGYVVPFAIPEVIRHANAFALGAQYTHPGATVQLIWTNSWFDPATEKKAAQSLHAAGADVIGQNVDSPAAGQYSESAGIPWVGYDSDASKFAPKSWLTASVYNWGPYYLKRVKAAMAGTWKSGFYYGTINDGLTKLAPFGPGVTAATKAKIAGVQKKLENGSFYEFQGPLYDQSGKLRVAQGRQDGRPQGRHEQPVRHELAREGRHREPEGLEQTSEGAPAPAPPSCSPSGDERHVCGSALSSG